jgi:hypothetical protein
MIGNFDDLPEFSFTEFHNLIYEYDLSPDFELTRENGSIVVNELWSNDYVDIIAKRVYEFDPFFVELIPNEIVLDVLKEVLEIHVFDENYEEAIIIRDIIKEQMFDLS